MGIICIQDTRVTDMKCGRNGAQLQIMSCYTVNGEHIIVYSTPVQSTLCMNENNTDSAQVQTYSIQQHRSLNHECFGCCHVSVPNLSLSHTDPICVIQRVIMENRPFTCGQTTGNHQTQMHTQNEKMKVSDDDGGRRTRSNFPVFFSSASFSLIIFINNAFAPLVLSCPRALFFCISFFLLNFN